MFQFWTYHPDAFRVDNPTLKLDHTQGTYWDVKYGGMPTYRQARPKLVQLLGVNDFLWCCPIRGLLERYTLAHDLVEWEINVPASQIVSWLDNLQWEKFVRDPSMATTGLLISQPTTPSKDHVAFVAIPLKPGQAIRHEMEPKH